MQKCLLLLLFMPYNSVALGRQHNMHLARELSKEKLYTKYSLNETKFRFRDFPYAFIFKHVVVKTDVCNVINFTVKQIFNYQKSW